MCHYLFDRVKGPVVKSRHRHKLSRYNGDVRRRRSCHFRFLLRGGAPMGGYQSIQDRSIQKGWGLGYGSFMKYYLFMSLILNITLKIANIK